MTDGRALRATSLAITLLVAACTGPSGASRSEVPSGEASQSGASPSAESTPTASPRRTLATFEPDETWRPILELIPGPLGAREGSFAARSRYRIRYDCVGEGSIAVRVANRVRARRDCGDEEIAQPQVVRSGGAARLRARVTAEGEVEWIVRFEVPR